MNAYCSELKRLRLVPFIASSHKMNRAMIRYGIGLQWRVKMRSIADAGQRRSAVRDRASAASDRLVMATRTVTGNPPVHRS